MYELEGLWRRCRRRCNGCRHCHELQSPQTIHPNQHDVGMHELSIALSIIDLAEEEMRLYGGERVRSIRIEVGSLAGVASDALLFSFGLACEGTPAEGSSLIVDETQGRELDVVAVEIEP